MGVFTTFELLVLTVINCPAFSDAIHRVLTVIDCLKIVGAIAPIAPVLNTALHSQFSHNLILKGSQDFLYTFCMALYHKCDVTNGFLISDGPGGVILKPQF